jgi:hypothetical protein
MRLIAAGLLIIAGVLTYGLADISASILRAARPGVPLEASFPGREIGAIIQLVGFFMFVCEYFADLLRKEKGKTGGGGA